jgi:hypothetical protein
MSNKGCMCCICAFNGGFGTCDMAKCSMCDNQVSSGSYKLCSDCSTEHEKCYQCGKDINFDDSELDTYLQKLNKRKEKDIEMYKKYLPDGVKSYEDRYQSMCDKLTSGQRNFI